MNERKRRKFYFERGKKPACSPARWQAGEVQDKIFRLQPRLAAGQAFEAPVEQVYLLKDHQGTNLRAWQQTGAMSKTKSIARNGKPNSSG